MASLARIIRTISAWRAAGSSHTASNPVAARCTSARQVASRLCQVSGGARKAAIDVVPQGVRSTRATAAAALSRYDALAQRKGNGRAQNTAGTPAQPRR
jgi:hypothetical protein